MDTFILFFEIISIVILLIDLNKKVVPSSKIINGGDYSSVSNYFLLKILNYMLYFYYILLDFISILTRNQNSIFMVQYKYRRKSTHNILKSI